MHNQVLDTSISPNYQKLKDKLSKFSLSSFNAKADIERYVQAFEIDTICTQIAADSANNPHSELKRTVMASQDKPFEPEYGDLCRLHYLTLTRKPINVLEFGSGFSTLIFANAMEILSEHFQHFAQKHFRADKLFHTFSIEEEQRFLDVTKQRLSLQQQEHVSLSRSSVELIQHDNRFATVYSKLPDISPDFIYLDGPSLFGTTSEINGFSMTNQCRMPMSADILRVEFFLEPGTLILVDGRTANARFLRAYLKRDWAYMHDPIGDIHYFELQEEALGKINATKLAFCLNNKWLVHT